MVRLFSITSSSSTDPTFSPNSILSGSPVYSDIIDDNKNDHGNDSDFSPTSIISNSPHSSHMSDYTTINCRSPSPPIPVLPKSNTFSNKRDFQCTVEVKQLTEAEAAPYPCIRSEKLLKAQKESVETFEVVLPVPKKQKSIHLQQLLTPQQSRILQSGETFSSISIQSDEVDIH
mgnify:FL=1